MLLAAFFLFHRPAASPTVQGSAAATTSGTPLLIRLVEGTRQRLGPRSVALLEDGWYSLTDHVQQRAYWLAHPRPAPPASGPRSTAPASSVRPPPPGGASAAAPTPGIASLPPTPIIPTSWPRATDEGVWQPAGQAIDGQTALARTFVLPDPQRPYARVDLVWIDPLRAHLHLVAGTQYPAIPSGLHGTGEVPPDARPRLLAAFNGGFQRTADRYGSVGFRVAGQWFTPPTRGLATVAVDAAGRVTLGAWGSEVSATPLPTDLRQNLPLILDQGGISPHIDDGAYWGITVNNTVRVWRSGLGQTADGALIYAAGTPLTARGLAEALQAAGAQRAMELDINSYWVTFNFYFPDGPTPGAIRGEKLMAAMTRPATRYLTPDSRDFFYLTAAG